MNRVLLIDDDEQLGPPLAMYFKRFDLVLEQAFTPSKGLARLQEGNFDAAILDIMLPEMDGFEVCRRIRKGSQVPIIMLTARGELTDRVVGLETLTTTCPSPSSPASWWRGCRRCCDASAQPLRGAARILLACTLRMLRCCVSRGW